MANSEERTAKSNSVVVVAAVIERDNCFLIGDSAGLASVDLGEGIGPAVESGLLAAKEILGTGAYRKQAISTLSFGGVMGRLMRRVNRRHVAT